MRASVLLLLALAELLGVARGASDAPAEAPEPLRRVGVAELAAMQARLAAMAQDVQRALATAPGAPAPSPAMAKLDYLEDSTRSWRVGPPARVKTGRARLRELREPASCAQMALDALYDLHDATHARDSASDG